MEKTSYMRIVEIKRYAVLFLFLIVISIYYVLTIPSNSIWHDQTLAVNLAKDVLNGNYPLVGYLHSNRMHSFPAFYYLIAPLVYISDNAIFFILVCCCYEYIRSNDCNQVYLLKIWVSGICYIFCCFLPHMFPHCFFHPFFGIQIILHFFMSLFIVSVFKYLNDKKSVIYFHIAGIIINIMVQMMPQSIVLIPSFIFIFISLLENYQV